MVGEGRVVGLWLRFVTVGRDQFRGCPRGECDIRPVLRRIAGFEGRANHTGGDEFVESAPRVSRLGPRRDKLGNHAAMSCDRDTFARLDTPDVAAQVVLELADTGGSHHSIIATCGLMVEQSRGCRFGVNRLVKMSPTREER
jgi:hypothetical protein